MKDGRILPATHWASLVVFAILVPALVILWGMPDRTADAWAWTIQPDLTPIFLGAGYGAGAYFFLRTFLSDKFPPSSAGIFGAAFFATLMLIATLIHWDRFNHGDAPLIGALVFYGWVAVYIISPFVVFGLWWFNRRTDSGEPAPGEAIVPAGVRRIAQVVAVGSFLGAAFFFLAPDEAIDVWPWDLTPLTSRVIGSFTAQVGVGALMISLDPRWGSWKLIVQTFFVATALLLIGAIRAWDDFDTGNALTYFYLGGLVAADIALLLLYRSMGRQEAQRSGALWVSDELVRGRADRARFEVLRDSEAFPEWWEGVTSVEVLEPGGPDGVGARARYSWRSVLPYTLTFESHVTRVEPPYLIEGHATGELEGVGVWRLFAGPDNTAALYSWRVRTTKLWMNVWGPLPRPAFRWNHDRVMAQGGVGLARRLGASLLVHD